MRYFAMIGVSGQNSLLEHFIGGTGASIAISVIVCLIFLPKPKLSSFRFQWQINISDWFDRNEALLIRSAGPIINLIAAIYWEATQAFSHVYGELPRGYMQYNQLSVDAISSLVAYLILRNYFSDQTFSKT